MQKQDEIRLRHMYDAASEAVAFAKGKDREDLDKDRMMLLALVKELEIIGEATAKLSQWYTTKPQNHGVLLLPTSTEVRGISYESTF